MVMMSCYIALDEVYLDDSRSAGMATSRKTDREGQEITLQYQRRQETLSREELDEFKLTQLLAFIKQLEQTPVGLADLRRRTRLFGECVRLEGESTAEFHGRLRFWLDRNLPQTKTTQPAQWQAYD